MAEILQRPSSYRALLPLLEGRLADRIGVQYAFVVPAVRYVYIAGFGFATRHLMTSTSYPGEPFGSNLAFNSSRLECWLCCIS